MYTSNEDELFCSKIEDIVSLSEVRQKPVFSQFMSERKQALAIATLKKLHFDNYCFYGGHDESERKILGVFFYDSDIEKHSLFPVSPIEFRFRQCDKLTHRDFMGALMSLGIERDTIGDILVEDGRCVIFVKTELKEYIESQIFKIGRTGVKVVDCNLSDLPLGRGVDLLEFTVSSLRLDNIVAAVCGLSRDKTSRLILSGVVSHNYQPEQNVSKVLKQGDSIIIRGKGKFILDKIYGLTKKGRHKITVLYYK